MPHLGKNLQVRLSPFKTLTACISHVVVLYPFLLCTFLIYYISNQKYILFAIQKKGGEVQSICKITLIWHQLYKYSSTNYFFFFLISKHQYISKGKRRKAYREYTRRQRPHNKITKATKNPPALNWRLSTPGNL